MPLDPSIPLKAQVAQIESPFDALSKIASLQQVRDTQEARRLAGEEARTKAQRQQQIDDAYQRAVKVDPATGKVTIDRAVLFANVHPSALPELTKQVDEDEERVARLQKGTLDLAQQKQEMLGSFARTVVAGQGDPTIWGVELRGARQMELIDDDTYARLSAISDPAKILAAAQGYAQRPGATPQGLQKVTHVPTAGPYAGKEVEEFVIPKPGEQYVQPPKAAGAEGVSYQDQSVLLDGKPTLVSYNPKTATWHSQGQDVSARVRPLPPIVDPTLAATRGIQAQLAEMQLAGGGLTPNQRAQEINTLRNSWTRQIQPVLERRGAVAKIDAGLGALKAGNRNAATQIIITAFNKLQDETSVVREGEYARSEQGQALVARIQGALVRITEGGANLTDADLTGLATEAKNVATALEAETTAALTDTRQAMEETLDEFKIPHSRVFGGSTIGRRQTGGGGGDTSSSTPKKPNPFAVK